MASPVEKGIENDEFSSSVLHVHDLPQLYANPPAPKLLSALRLLSRPANGFAHKSDSDNPSQNILVDPAGVTRYLTDIVASPLMWVPESERDQVWEEASTRLSERSGRNAAPSMTRTFHINSDLHLELYEPSLTEDNLGLKTWASSLLLSQRLGYLSTYLPSDRPTLLELGAGTGLVGLAAAYLWRDIVSEIVLTDLPEIVPNLQRNISHNVQLLSSKCPQLPDVSCRILDWSNESDEPSPKQKNFSIIAAADPIYSSDHPRILVQTVRRWLTPDSQSRFIVHLPLREGYARERDDLKRRLCEFMTTVEEGEDVGFDDWQTTDGDPAEVTCWWAIWKLTIFN